jgi:hypothetical protein
VISPKARLRCASVSPKGASNSFCAIASRCDVASEWGRLAEAEAGVGLRTDEGEDLSAVMGSL